MIALAFLGLGHQELLVIALLVVLLFGATKLPKLASSVGESVKNFKRGMREVEAEEEAAKKNKLTCEQNNDSKEQSDNESTNKSA